MNDCPLTTGTFKRTTTHARWRDNFPLTGVRRAFQLYLCHRWPAVITVYAWLQHLDTQRRTRITHSLHLIRAFKPTPPREENIYFPLNGCLRALNTVEVGSSATRRRKRRNPGWRGGGCLVWSTATAWREEEMLSTTSRENKGTATACDRQQRQQVSVWVVREPEVGN